MHKSVLSEELTNIIKKTFINTAIDFTFGSGGHTKIFLENNINSKIISIDRDPFTKKYAEEIKKLYNNRFEFYNDISYNMDLYTKEADFILGDLGISQMQLFEDRGFSYKNNNLLDMQMGKDSLGSLKEKIKELSFLEISEIIRNYGEEKKWFIISKNIYNNRKYINTTYDLKSCILNSIGKTDKENKILSRCFQAFRIFINQEINILKKTLEVSFNLLKPNGTLAIITFHSLEDRIVKNFLKNNFFKLDLIFPSKKEIENNPFSRSSKLRIGINKKKDKI